MPCLASLSLFVVGFSVLLVVTTVTFFSSPSLPLVRFFTARHLGTLIAFFGDTSCPLSDCLKRMQTDIGIDRHSGGVVGEFLLDKFLDIMDSANNFVIFSRLLQQDTLPKEQQYTQQLGSLP